MGYINSETFEIYRAGQLFFNGRGGRQRFGSLSGLRLIGQLVHRHAEEKHKEMNGKKDK